MGLPGLRKASGSPLHPALPVLVSLDECWAAVGAPPPCQWCVVSKLVGDCGGASWGLGGDEDEEVFPYCINEYLYD